VDVALFETGSISFSVQLRDFQKHASVPNMAKTDLAAQGYHVPIVNHASRNRTSKTLVGKNASYAPVVNLYGLT